METKRVILARFVDFDVTPIKRVTMATRCQMFRKILFLLENSWKIVFSNYLPQFYIFYHFLSK